MDEILEMTYDPTFFGSKSLKFELSKYLISLSNHNHIIGMKFDLMIHNRTTEPIMINLLHYH